MAALGSSVIFV